MPSTDYEKKIIEDLKEIMKKWSYSTPDTAFVHWALRIVSNSDDDELCADSYTNGADDLGIDGIMIVEGDPNVIYFVQAKYITSLAKVDRADVREFIGNTIKILRDPKLSLTGNNNIRRLSRDARDILKDAPDTKVVLCYFNFGKFAPNALTEINDWKKEFKKATDFVRNFEIQVFDHDAVMQTYIMNLDTSEMPVDIVLPVVNGQVFENEKSVLIDDSEVKQKSIVFTTKASDIGDLRNKFGRNLFSLNVRYSLGTKSNKVNEGMLKTLNDLKEKDKFWFYNNGIYATCDKYKISEDGKSVKVDGMQVVNGCQTCTVFGEALLQGANLDSVEILIRLVEGRKGKIIPNISTYTNTQNAVKARDLHSNDPIQDKLFQSFQDNPFFDHKYFYERKRGEMLHFSKTRQTMTRGREKIDNKDVAQAFLAFFKKKPSRAKASADILFRDNYSEIFVENTTEASHLFYPWYVSRVVKNFVKTQSSTPTQEYLSQSNSTFVAFIGYCFMKKFNMEYIEKLAEEFRKMGEDNFLKHVEYYLERGVQIFNYVVMSKNGGVMPDQNFDARRFFLDQDLFEKSIIPAVRIVASMAKLSEKDIWNLPKG